MILIAHLDTALGAKHVISPLGETLKNDGMFHGLANPLASHPLRAVK
jgi:hypothetical protein